MDFCDFCFNNSLVTSIIHWSEFIMKKNLTILGWIMGARVHYRNEIFVDGRDIHIFTDGQVTSRYLISTYIDKARLDTR